MPELQTPAFQVTGKNILNKEQFIQPQAISSILDFKNEGLAQGTLTQKEANSLDKIVTQVKAGEKVTWEKVADILGDSLWKQFQTWHQQQQWGKEAVETAIGRPGRAPKAVVDYTIKHTAEVINENAKIAEKGKKKHDTEFFKAA